MEGNGPEIVERPNPNKGKEITQIVPLKTVRVMREAALHAGLQSFRVIGRPGNEYDVDGTKLKIEKGYARVRLGWKDITEQSILDGFNQRVNYALNKTSKRK